MKKRLLLLLSFVLCIAFMTGCSSSSSKETDVTVSDDVMNIVDSTTSTNFDLWVSSDFSETIESGNLDEEYIAQYQSWQDLKDRLGELRSQTEIEDIVDADEESITSTINGEFEHGKVKFVMTFDLNGNATNVKVDEVESKGQIMEKALLNTLMGMGTVFIVLILISLVISCFGLIGKQQAKKAAAEKAKASQKAPVAPVVMAPVAEEPTNLTDDLELVAVVTAAIMASMGDEAPAEGLVVRSIKKRNASKWKNA